LTISILFLALRLYLVEIVFAIFGFDELVGVAGEVAEQGVRGGTGIDAEPVFVGLVIGLADAVVLGFEFVYPFGLAFERHDRVIGAVKERKHVSADIENQHVRRIPERRKRQFLLHIHP